MTRNPDAGRRRIAGEVLLPVPAARSILPRVANPGPEAPGRVLAISG